MPRKTKNEVIKTKKPNILIVIPKYSGSIEKDFLYTFPLGMSYVSSAMKNNGYQVDCLNMNHLDGSTKDIVSEKLSEKRYDILCTGNMALGYQITEDILSSAKEHESKPMTILGGLIITSEPDAIFNGLQPDIGVIGEAEETIIELLDAIEKKKDLSKVCGIIFKNNGTTVMTQQRMPKPTLDDMPYPDFDGFEFSTKLDNTPNDADSQYTFDEARIYPILGSRGCPFQCTFCYHPTKYRARTIDNIMKELKENVVKYKINFIILYDDCFASSKERIFDFCKGMKMLRASIPWDLQWSGQLIVNSIDTNVLSAMKEAGCRSISYGFESFSPIVLRSMKKYITPKQIEFAFHETLKAGIRIQANFIFGDVAETMETANETIEWYKKNANGQVSLTYIRPYPGSAIYEHCIRKGLITDKIDFFKHKLRSDSNHIINMTESMSDEEDRHLKTKIIPSLELKYTKSVTPLKATIENKTKNSFEAKCPYCGKMNNYKNIVVPNKRLYFLKMSCRECPMLFIMASPSVKFYIDHLSDRMPQLFAVYVKVKKMLGLTQ